jgi:hypothetical protein
MGEACGDWGMEATEPALAAELIVGIDSLESRLIF